MEPAATTRAFTRARIVAFAVIGLAVLGLLYLRLCPTADRYRCRKAPAPAS
jgi:hypothetical protein